MSFKSIFEKYGVYKECPNCKNKSLIELEEGLFVCDNCGKKVTKLGYSCRNHCPYCLHSKHVDKNPGDREESCHGMLEPIGLETDSKKGYVIIFKCKKCGMIRKNKAAEDDNMDLIIDLSSKQYEKNYKKYCKIKYIFI